MWQNHYKEISIVTNKKQKSIIDQLSIIIMKAYDFNNTKIEVNYVARAKHSKTWIIDIHNHPWFEFNYVSKGSVYTTMKDHEFLVTAGQSYIIPAGVPHSHRHNNTGDDGFCIRFSLESINNNNESNEIIKLLSKPHIAPFYSDIEKLILTGGVYSTQAAFALWLMNLNDKWDKNEKPISSAEITLSPQVILYLNEYYQTKIKVNDIANALNTSYRSLSRNFKLETGITIYDKLTEIRLKKAKQLLISTKMTMYDIAVASGYENEFYFSKIFKQQEKISPSCYRSKFRIHT